MGSNVNVLSYQLFGAEFTPWIPIQNRVSLHHILHSDRLVIDCCKFRSAIKYPIEETLCLLSRIGEVANLSKSDQGIRDHGIVAARCIEFDQTACALRRTMHRYSDKFFWRHRRYESLHLHWR